MTLNGIGTPVSRAPSNAHGWTYFDSGRFAYMDAEHGVWLSLDPQKRVELREALVEALLGYLSGGMVGDEPRVADAVLAVLLDSGGES